MESTLGLALFTVFAVCFQIAPTLSEDIQYSPLGRNIGSCDPVTVGLFGSVNGFSDIGVLPVTFIRDDGGAPELVNITGFAVLCEAIGSTRGSASSVSVLLDFDHIDHRGNIAHGQQRQITIDCQRNGETHADSFYPAASPNADGTDLDTTASAGGVKVQEPPNILADFTTPTDTRCGKCITSLASNAVRNVTNCYRKF